MDNRLDYQKVRLLPVRQGHKWQQILIDKEREIFGFTIEPRYEENTKVVSRLSDADFDALLAENIVFLDLYDSNANNAIVECIARATPLLVNSLPAVVEHLGPDYPLYFDSLSEAAEKTLDTKLIYEAHLHLKNCQTRHKLHPEYFLNSVTESEVYQQL